jgi:hypothetical protein
METDHDELAREVESRGEDMEQRRDELERDTEGARQDVRDKSADQSVPGLQEASGEGESENDGSEREDDQAEEGAGEDAG